MGSGSALPLPVPHRLLDVECDCVGTPAIHDEDEFHLAAPSQRAWNFEIELIQPREISLRAREADFGSHAAQRATHVRQRAALAKTGAKADEETIASLARLSAL